MTLKVVPLPALEGIKFDVIMEDLCVVTLALEDEQLRQYRCSVSQAIEAHVREWLAQHNYAVDELQIIFC